MVLDQKIETTKNRTLFYLLFTIMISMVGIRNVLHIDFPVVLFLGVVVIIAMFCGKDDIIALALVSLPLSTAFQYKYALFICIIIYCIRFSKDVRITAKVIPIILMILWEMLHISMGYFIWIELLRGFSELIFLAFLFSVSDEEFDLTHICRMLSFATVAMCIFILFILLEDNSYDFSKLFLGTIRFGAADEKIENFGLNFNENGLGFICNLSIISILLSSDTNKLKTFDFILICLLAVFGTMTMSRTFLVCLAIIIIYYFSFQTGSSNKKIARIVGIILIGFIGFILLKAVLPQVIDNFTKRFLEEDISNGRTELFEFYNNHITSSPIYLLFGIGLQSIPDKIEAIHSSYINVCHNGVQELIVVWGIPGLVLFLCLIYSICSKNTLKNHKRKFLQYGPLLLFIISTMAGQLITNNIALLGLSLAYLCLNNSVKNKGDELWKEKE